MSVGRAASLVAVAALVAACSTTKGPRVAPTTVPPTSTSVVDTPSAHAFDDLMGATNAPAYAFATRLEAVAPGATVLPPEVAQTASAAAAAFSTAASSLQFSTFPPATPQHLANLTTALKALAADLQLVASGGVPPSLLASWRGQFQRDGSVVNAAWNAVRTDLGLPPLPSG